MLQASTLKFLKGLAKNNNKPWFDRNRDAYDNARKDFEIFIQKIIDRHSEKDHDLKNLSARNCLFRINRDIRFSKNKTPYKLNFAASLDRDGKKSGYAGYYFHLEPGKSFLGAGIWQPEGKALQKLRQEIDYSVDEFKAMINDKKFKKHFAGLYTGENVQLKKVPAGFDKENPAAEYLKFKSWMVLQDLSDDTIVSNSLLKITLDAYDKAMPFVKFLNRALEP